MYAKITHMAISTDTTAPAAGDTALTFRGFRPQQKSANVSDAIDRVAASKLPGQIKKWLLIGLFYVGTLAGAWGAELRTNAGVDHQSRVTFDTASNGTGSYAAANYLALTEDAGPPDAAHTALAGELTGEGLARVQMTYAHTNGTNTTTLTKTVTMTSGTTRTLRMAGNLNAATTGTLAYETLVPNPPVLVPSDSVAFTWTYSF